MKLQPHVGMQNNASHNVKFSFFITAIKITRDFDMGTVYSGVTGRVNSAPPPPALSTWIFCPLIAKNKARKNTMKLNGKCGKVEKGKWKMKN